jgi:predicted metalloprotease with PDZ domain
MKIASTQRLSSKGKIMNRNTKIITATLTLIIFTLSAFSVASDSTGETGISYIIEIDKVHQNIARITATFIPVDDRLFMFSGANGFPKRWAKFISHVNVVDENSHPIKVTALEDATWKLVRTPDQPISLSYQVNLDHENFEWSGGVDGAAYERDWGVFYTSRALFIVNGEDNSNIRLTFKLPENWQITSPWIALDKSNHVYGVNNFTELATSMFFAGTHKEVSIQRGDYELLLALGGSDLIAQHEEFINLAKGVFDYYSELMGGGPKLSDEITSNKSVVIINPGNKTDGEAIGNNISILIEPDGGQMSQVISRFIFAHEFFHLWNGKTFAPQSDDTEWFKEGFSNYYTLKSLHHVGFLNDDSYLSLLADFFYQKYDSDPGVGQLSMTAGEQKHDHWGLIYAGGFFVGIAQDMLIRKESANAKSLDDLMRYFYRRFDGNSGGYTLADIQSELSELSQNDQHQFFSQYVTGVDKLPLEYYLSFAGITSSRVNNKLVLSRDSTATVVQQQLLAGLYGIQ